MAVAALLEALKQVAEAAAQHAAGRGAAEQSAQSALEEVAQVAARGGAGRRARRLAAEQPAENIGEAAASIARCRTASGRYAGRLALSAGAGGVAATTLERLVCKQSEERDDDRRHAAAAAAAGLRLAAGAILHAGENVAQSHVCLQFLSEPDIVPSAPPGGESGETLSHGAAPCALPSRSARRARSWAGFAWI